MKTKSIVAVVLALAGLLGIVAVVACAGLFIFAVRDLGANLSPTIDELFAAIENDSFASTYDSHTSPEFRRAATREQYEQIGLTIKTRLGSLKSKTLRQFNMRQMNASRYADVVYNGVFEKGSGVISGRFVKQGDRWLIVAFNVSSPEFQKDLATQNCPHCGAAHTSSAKFCPGCGKPLADDGSVKPAG